MCECLVYANDKGQRDSMFICEACFPAFFNRMEELRETFEGTTPQNLPKLLGAVEELLIAWKTIG